MEERIQVYETWESSGLFDPQFLEAALRDWTESQGETEEEHFPPVLKRALESASLEDSETSRQFRSKYADTLEHGLAGDPRYERMKLQDHKLAERARAKWLEGEPERRRVEKEREEQAKASALAVQKRQETIEALGRLSLHDRVSRLASPDLELEQPWPIDWAQISDHDLRAVPLPLRVALQRKLKNHRRGPWKKLRGRIHVLNKLLDDRPPRPTDNTPATGKNS